MTYKPSKSDFQTAHTISVANETSNDSVKQKIQNWLAVNSLKKELDDHDFNTLLGMAQSSSQKAAIKAWIASVKV